MFLCSSFSFFFLFQSENQKPNEVIVVLRFNYIKVQLCLTQDNIYYVENMWGKTENLLWFERRRGYDMKMFTFPHIFSCFSYNSDAFGA